MSTGLRYLLVPLANEAALTRARIARQDFSDLLERLGAQFVYVLDADRMEGRHWNHVGGLEDIATGSAAGCVAAYLRKHERIAASKTVVLNQGRFTGRPSRLRITAVGSGEDITSVRVAGEVALVGEGRLILPPRV